MWSLPFQVAGSVLPIIEMQARWIGHVFAGDCVLPPADAMRERVQHRIDNCWPGYASCTWSAPIAIGR
jgi:hypothetical protein